ncbi:MAG: YibE/F family protein [Chloroflexota bacterium]|nr:YibE/F family protein [Chloroflexota bacterium]
MTKEMKRFLLIALLMLIIFSALILLLVPRLDAFLSGPRDDGPRIGLGDDMYKAEVFEIIEEGTVTLGERTQSYQVFRVEVLEGPYKGLITEIDYGKRQVRPEGSPLETGDQLIVSINQAPDGSVNSYFIDFVRTKPLIWLLVAFVLFSVLVGGWQGARGLLGLAVSLVVILVYIIPSILDGKDPIVVTLIGGFFLLGISLYLIYGWALKTHAAVLALFFTLVFTGLMINFFVDLTRLTGFGDEDILFVIQQVDININMRGLVLAGMLIGAMGALDDLVITQVSVVLELHEADSELGARSLYQRAMRVGQDHISAMINTLFMAYAGAALPTLILFSLSGQGFVNLINLEFVAEEVVRILAGSLGLIAAAPIATGIASLMIVYRGRLLESGQVHQRDGEPEHIGDLDSE